METMYAQIKKILENGRKTTAICTIAIGRVSCFKDIFVVNQSLVFQIKFCVKVLPFG